MRTTEKDILYICKGHWDHSKHKNLEAALDAYYRKEYGVSKKDLPVLSYKFMVNLWFVDCVKEFLRRDTIYSFIYHVIKEEGFQEKSFVNEDECTEFYEVLFHRIVTWMILLPARDKDGNWTIDLSEYEGDLI